MHADSRQQPSEPATAGYPSRLDELSASMRELHEALDGQEPLDGVLRRLADTVVRAVPDADLVSVTIMIDGQLQTAAATDDRVEGLDQQQGRYTSNPYRDAVDQHRPLRIELDDTARQRWPDFAHAAETAGVRAYLSAPVFIDADSEHYTHGTGGELLGVLNLYSDTAGAFDPFDEALLRLLTTTVAAAITSARRHQDTRTLVDQLQHALDSRVVIEQAKGVLMAVHSIEPEAAFQRLVSESQHTNTRLHTVARNLLASL